MLTKKQRLNYARKQLKKDFIGINAQIDSIIDSIASWYLHPELCTKPTVICLWSITGLGKTTLVKNLVNYLGLGDCFVSVTFSSKRHGEDSFSQLVGSKLAPTDQGILFLDEFQRYKAIDKKENDLRNIGYDDLWGLLSDGQLLKPASAVFAMQTMLEMIDEYKAGIIEELLNAVKDNSRKDSPCVYRSSGDAITSHSYMGKYQSELGKHDKSGYIPPHEFIFKASTLGEKTFKELFKLRAEYKAFAYELDAKEERIKVEYLLESLNYIFLHPVEPEKWDTISFDDVVDLITETLEYYKYNLPNDKMAYKKLLVVIAGNHDELFGGKSEFSSSYKDVESLYDYTSRLKWYQLKSLLLTNLYPEQISRLGTNHIIYPSLTDKAYKAIINRELNFIKSEYKREGITIKITERAFDAIYKNSVFPAQGARPIKSRIQEIVLSPISLYVTLYPKIKSITFDIDPTDSKVIINDKELKCKVNLEVTDKENDALTRKDTSTIVHEVGHAIVTMWLFNLPCLIDLAPLSSDSDAYTQFLFSQIPNYRNITGLNKTALANICIYLAGRVAEEFVFGTENTSHGNYSDYKMATLTASNLLRNVGNGSGIAAVSSPLTSPFDIDSDLTHATCDARDAEIEALLKKEYMRAKEILTAAKDVMIGMVEFLQKHAYMSRKASLPYLKQIRKLKAGTRAQTLSALDINNIWNSFKHNGVQHLNRGNQ